MKFLPNNQLQVLFIGCCITLKIMLILLPHVVCNPISPLIGSSYLVWCHRILSQSPSRPRMTTHFKVNQLVIVRANLLGVILPDEVVNRHKGRWNEGLSIHIILWWMLEDFKMLLENPKDLLDDIASRCMMQIKQFLGVAWTWMKW